MPKRGILFFMLNFWLLCAGFSQPDTLFYKNGGVRKIVNVIDGKEFGPCSFYTRKGNEDRRFVYLGKRRMIVTHYFRNKKRYIYHARQESGGKSWKREGGYTSFYSSGIISEHGFFLNDKKDNSWMAYDKKGNLVSWHEYLNGKLHGNYVEYDSLGNVILQGKFVRGKPVGNWISYYTSKSIQGIGEMDYVVPPSKVSDAVDAPDFKGWYGEPTPADPILVKIGIWEYYDEAGNKANLKNSSD